MSYRSSHGFCCIPRLPDLQPIKTMNNRGLRREKAGIQHNCIEPICLQKIPPERHEPVPCSGSVHKYLRLIESFCHGPGTASQSKASSTTCQLVVMTSGTALLTGLRHDKKAKQLVPRLVYTDMGQSHQCQIKVTCGSPSAEFKPRPQLQSTIFYILYNIFEYTLYTTTYSDMKQSVPSLCFER